MPQIVSLKANMSLAEAASQFRGGAARAWFLARWRGPLVGVGTTYIPYRVFQVEVSNRGQKQVSWLALDAVTAQLDLYQFDSPPAPMDVLSIETDAALPARLSVGDMRPILIERVRRQVYLGGFFRLRGLQIEVESAGMDLHLPYWVGICRKGNRVSFEVINAVRRQLEGAKMRGVLLQWVSDEHLQVVTPLR
ncbi:MAG: hypothetical protein HY314_16025 [Acidobacteria bacterium]|nr:hypothetical protein [Acidobacteriota bacterium]